MRYQGGKGHIRGKLGALVRQFSDGRPIVEPFCGGLSMTCELMPRAASDFSRPVITLVEAVRSGWRPPQEISDEQYRALARSRDQEDPLTCFAGQCCSFGGRWFGGLARGHATNPHPVLTAGETLVSRVAQLDGVQFRHCDYREAEVRAGDTVYCDPPYIGSTASWPTPKFDHAEFWTWAQDTAATGAIVLVSEFDAPDGVEMVASFDRSENLRSAARSRPVEKLFRA